MQYDASSDTWVLRGQVIRAEGGRDLQRAGISGDGQGLLAGNCRYLRVQGQHNLRVFGGIPRTMIGSLRARIHGIREIRVPRFFE